MKNQIKKITVIIIIAIGAISCNDWLTIQPVTESSSEQLVFTENGLKLILAGTYTQMMSTPTSGGPYSPLGIETLEQLSGFWDFSPGMPGYYWGHANYEATSSMQTANDYLFKTYYNLIANINPAINGMVEHREKLNARTYALIRGEALAIRACLHLDLMRIYGPVPYKVDADEKYLPYVTVNGSKPYAYYTFDEYMNLLIADLNEAEVLLGEYDPVLTTNFLDSEISNGVWPNYNRKATFNYYGVLALQARARLWRGSDAYNDKNEALRYARLVKDAVDSYSGESKFRLTTEKDYDPTISSWSDDRLYFSEQICGVKSKDYVYSDYMNMWNPRYIRLYNYYIYQMYPKNGSDLRYTKNFAYYSGTGVYGYYTSKYSCFTASGNSPKNFPVIRLSEIYFMIMELSTLDEANELYEEYCISRNVVNDWNPFEPMTEENRRETILLEFLREYMGEAQNFYMYKRYGAKNKYFIDTEMTEESYRVPIPQGEARVEF